MAVKLLVCGHPEISPLLTKVQEDRESFCRHRTTPVQLFSFACYDPKCRFRIMTLTPGKQLIELTFLKGLKSTIKPREQ